MMSRLDRPTMLKLAAVGVTFLALVELFVYDLPEFARGPVAVDQIASRGDGPPYALVIIQSVVALIALAGAYGTWRGRRWAIALVVICSVLMLISSVLGALFAPLLTTRIWGIITIVLELLIISACLWRQRGGSLSQR